MRVYERATELLEARVAEDIVALQPDLGICFGLNSVASMVWDLLNSPASFVEIKTKLLEEYDVDEARCDAELQDLLAQMQELGLARCIES